MHTLPLFSPSKHQSTLTSDSDEAEKTFDIAHPAFKFRAHLNLEIPSTSYIRHSIFERQLINCLHGPSIVCIRINIFRGTAISILNG